MDSPNEEYESTYRKGWTLCLHQNLAKRKRKRKSMGMGTGTCVYERFVYLLVSQGVKLSVKDLLDGKEFLLDTVTYEEVAEEKVLPTEAELDRVSGYILKEILNGEESMVLAGIIHCDYKSPCFDLSCLLVKLPTCRVSESMLPILVDEDSSWVISVDERIVMSLFSSPSYIGVIRLL